MAVEPVNAQMQEPLARRLAASVSALTIEDFDRTLVDKAQTCLYDLIGCALESVDKPWSRQAMALAAPLNRVSAMAPRASPTERSSALQHMPMPIKGAVGRTWRA